MNEMKAKCKKPILYTFVFFTIALLFYWLVKNDWKKTDFSFDSVLRGYTTQELTEDSILSQTITVPIECFDSLSLDINCFSTEENKKLSIILSQNNNVLCDKELSYSEIKQDELTTIDFDPPLIINGHSVTISIIGQGGVSLWAGNTRAAGRFVVSAQEDGSLSINGNKLSGQIVTSAHGYNRLNVLPYYWYVVAILYVLGLGIVIWNLIDSHSLLNRIHELARRYGYLLHQMISRDFRIKYKASIMGVLWSFLNPMLMTLVYYFVFSSIFKSSMENFVVYLMSGIILFNYFSEATSLGLISIVSNASLINKVYIPKYIFPLSKVLSSAINLCVSFIPLLILMAITGVHFAKSLLLIPLLIVILLTLTVGVSMIVSSMYVFFRDMQFLWSLVMTVWMFLTPIFYPETIIPERFIHFYHANPLYQLCMFARTIILEGKAPSPRNLLMCFVSALVMLIMGYTVFHKTQNRFTLYL